MIEGDEHGIAQVPDLSSAVAHMGKKLDPKESAGFQQTCLNGAGKG
jgi:hypothetical protein